MRRRLAPALIALTALGCRGVEVLPFAPVGPLTREEQFGLVRQRIEGIQRLAAVVQAQIDSPERRGSFTLYVLYERPGRLHLEAVKDVIVEERRLFTLTFTPQRFRFVAANEEGEAMTVGPLSDFPKRHPDLAPLFWIREALFLPGDGDGEELDPSCGPPESRARLAELRRRSRDGAALVYELDPDCLGVRSALVQAPGEPGACRITYRDYAPFDGIFLPREVEAQSLDETFGLWAYASEVELNQEAVPGVFEPLEAEAAPAEPGARNP